MIADNLAHSSWLIAHRNINIEKLIADRKIRKAGRLETEASS